MVFSGGAVVDSHPDDKVLFPDPAPPSVVEAMGGRHNPVRANQSAPTQALTVPVLNQRLNKSVYIRLFLVSGMFGAKI